MFVRGPAPRTFATREILHLRLRTGTQDDKTPEPDREGPIDHPKEQSQPVDEVERLRGELESKTEEVQKVNDKYLRVAAEFENYKRRALRDQNDTVRFATQKLAQDLLPTLDSLERAIQCGQEPSGSDGLLQGVELTLKQLLDTLTKMGVNQISSVGEPFDPSKHQAVGQVESGTVPPNSVVDELQKGYFLHDRILRPAMVLVAKPESESKSACDGEDTREEGGENS